MSDDLRAVDRWEASIGRTAVEQAVADLRGQAVLNSADRRVHGGQLRCVCDHAEAYLAEHPADDGEPVTEAWLREQGWRLAFPYPGRPKVGWATMGIGGATLLADILGEGRPLRLSIGGAAWEVINPTRGHVRRLLAALGATT